MRPFFLLVGGRGSHGPAPASASLYRLRRQTVLRETVRPSSRRHGWGANRRSTGAGREEYSHHPPTARSARRGRVPIPTHPQKPPKRGGARVRFYRTVGEARDNGSSDERSAGKQGKAPGQARRARALGRERSDFPTHGGRGIDGPPEGSLRPKAVERSTDRRRTVDSSPLPHAKKREP